MLKLRNYQKKAITEVAKFWTSKDNHMLIISPMASGKGIIQLEILKNRNSCILCTKISIMRNYLKELGYDTSTLSQDGIIKLGVENRIFTYTRYRNMLIENDDLHFDLIVIDEAHHWFDENQIPKQIEEMEYGSKYIGFTATPWRGNGIEQRDFDDMWERKYTAITIQELINMGYWTLPELHVIPLLDNSKYKIHNGEFSTAYMEYKIKDSNSINKLCDYIKENDKPGASIVRVSGVVIALEVLAGLQKLDIDSEIITSKTPEKERGEILKRLENGEIVLVQINVISEGFDLPAIRNLYDFAPTNRPGNWFQFFGRVVRPYKNKTKHYVCFCRNLEQHAYLLSGLIPNHKFKDIQSGFKNPWVNIRRSFNPKLGEKLCHCKPMIYKTKSGIWGNFFNFEIEGKTKKWNIIIIYKHMEPIPIVAHREICKTEFGNYDYAGASRYSKIKPDRLLNITEFKTCKYNVPITPKMRNWWHRSCDKFGLAPLEEYEPNSREFGILPVLNDLNERL